MTEQKPTPGNAIRKLLTERGWTQDDLARIIGRYRPEVTNLISGKRGISPELAIALGAAFSKPPEYWLELEYARQLAVAQENIEETMQRLRIYELAPIKDMQKRGWLRATNTPNDLEAEIQSFFGVESLENEPQFPVAARKSSPLSELTPSQRAWCFRAKQLANALPVKKFKKSKLEAIRSELRTMAAYPTEILRLPELMIDNGIRFIIIEPLPGSKIDGAAFWLDADSPVIAVSVRYDRIDAFWHTVLHEFAHIAHGDGHSIDDALVGDDAVEASVKNEQEQRADYFAVETLIPHRELDSFIRRVSPLYSKKRIIQFANRIKMHPGIIVGQLQFQGEVGYSALRDLLIKVRSDIVKVAFTDGWGHIISPDTLGERQ